MSIAGVRRRAMLAIVASVASTAAAGAQVSTPRTALPPTVTNTPKPPTGGCSGTHPGRELDAGSITFADSNRYYTWCVPEYHDDQRFALLGQSAEGTYGPIAHSLASPKVGSYTSHAAFDRGWVNVAIVDVERPVSPAPPVYAALGLTGERHCMYLRHDHSGASAVYQGLMVVPPATGKCPTSPTGGTPLRVFSDRPRGDDVVPPVTRFVEFGHGSVAVGVRCGREWCNVGTGERPPASAHASVAALTAADRGRVRGWFDDQMLGVLDASAPHGIRRGVRASVIPDAQLGSYTVKHFLAKPRIVARVFFPSAPPPKYANAGYGAGITTVWLAAREVSRSDGTKDTVWAATLVKHNGENKTAAVVRTDHSTWLKRMPPTARWRWDDGDEDLWAACGTGCCRVKT